MDTHTILGPPHVNPWIRLAEDAEKQAEEARTRAKQLLRAARIFRESAEKKVPYPGA